MSKHEVWIAWERTERKSWTHHKFGTIGELNAFLSGVDIAAGETVQFEQFDSEEEARAEGFVPD